MRGLSFCQCGINLSCQLQRDIFTFLSTLAVKKMSKNEVIDRRNCIPIIYTRGTHYEIGYDVGRTFASMIQELLNSSWLLNDVFLPAYETATGRKTYEDTLKSVKTNFPQYVRELQGTADGAEVPFHKLFLFHMDNITTDACQRAGNCEPVGCSSICVNNIDNEMIGHSEDAMTEVLNRFYIVSAHVITDEPQGKWGVTEERFTSLCYAGHLPGYTMNYNHHGLVFSINTLSVQKLYSGKTPRHFLTRALLSAENFEQAQNILKDKGCGAADGCSINMTFLQQEGDQLFYNIEMAPSDEAESQLSVIAAKSGEHILHCNMYLRLPVVEDDKLLESSKCRMATFKKYPPPTCKEDVVTMLGDESAIKFRVFRDSDLEKNVKTIAVGIFDCKEKTMSLYADNPRTNEPLVVLPIALKNKTKIVTAV